MVLCLFWCFFWCFERVFGLIGIFPCLLVRKCLKTALFCVLCVFVNFKMRIVDGRDCARGSVFLSKTMLIIYNIRAFFIDFGA